MLGKELLMFMGWSKYNLGAYEEEKALPTKQKDDHEGSNQERIDRRWRKR